jgi:hypothetical protein
LPTPSATAAPVGVATAPSARRVSRASRASVAATSLSVETVRRRDPLAALVHAVQAIPEDAWARGTSDTALAMPDVVVAPIAIPPLETSAIIDGPAEPLAPGEP